MILRIFFLFSTISSVNAAKSKAVSVSLDANWAQTSILAEIGEFLSIESSSAYWRFVQCVVEGSSAAEMAQKTDQQLYEFGFGCASQNRDSSFKNLLKASLAARIHSPSVQMFQQIASEHAESDRCEAFVQINSHTTCDINEINSLLEKAEPTASFVTLSVDHHFAQSAPVVVILYGDLSSDKFRQFHKELVVLARKGRIDYVHRPFTKVSTGDRSAGRIAPSTPVRLSGYGVELAIKSTEYKAQDDSKIQASTGEDSISDEASEADVDVQGFDFRTLKKLHPHLTDNLNEFKHFLYQSDELAPLKQWELQDLAFQAAQKVLSSDQNQKLDVLQDLSQNFPLHARALTRISVKPAVRSEIEHNQERLRDIGVMAGDSSLFINGLAVDVDSIDIYQLIELLKKEAKLASGFSELGFKTEYQQLITRLDLSNDAVQYAVDYSNAFPDFINNLDKDKTYKEWGNSVSMLLQPYFPGMIRPIARNFFTLIFIIDPASKEGRSLMQIADSFMSHLVPIRLGFLFVTPSKESGKTGLNDATIAMLNYYNFVKQDVESSAKALRSLVAVGKELSNRDDNITVDIVHKVFKKRYPDEELELAFAADSDYDSGRQAALDFLDKSGLKSAPKVLLNGVPLDDSGLSADKIEETIITAIMKATPKLQQAILDGDLTDQDNVAEWIMKRPDVMPRISARILEADRDTGNMPRSKFLDLTDQNSYLPKTLKEFEALSDRAQNQYIFNSMKYLKRSTNEHIRMLTIWVVVDLEQADGRAMMYNAIKLLKHSHDVRVGLVHNPRDVDVNKMKDSLSRLIQGAFWALPESQVKQFVTKLVKEEFIGKLKNGEITIDDLAVHEMDIVKFKKELSLMEADFLDMDASYATKVLSLKPGQRAIIANGQLIGPLDDDEAFTEDDFLLLEKYAMARYAQTVADHIMMWSVPVENDRASNMAARVGALVMADPVRKRRKWVTLEEEDQSVIKLTAEQSHDPKLDILAIIDPLSRDAQKLSHFLIVLRQIVNADMRVAMNPKSKLSEMPLKNFYRYVHDAELQFTVDGTLRYAPLAKFNQLPQKQLLTLNVLPPDSWLVQSVKALYDLDNIRMEQAETDIIAEYKLEHILLEGHCYDEVTGSPPRGLQFILGNSKNKDLFDTIVMANLGYFQLKANPGAWRLQLREGKSKDIYEIAKMQAAESLQKTNDEPEGVATVLINSFAGKVVRARVVKKPDKQDENLLSDGDDKDEDLESDSIWTSISNAVTGGDRASTNDNQEYETINIFSLASGHLYERFLRIMMLTVMKNTKHPVKFWLLKSYLSPYFKQFLPYMADKLGFEYELVEYKWPRWLHRQSEKQRIMWGYKILFLDVLFPLHVKKIIFVDADQIVRTDMMELMTFPLNGAPYAYTPFCDSRTEMEGFRFWKQGYWSKHLGTRRYHISALYVVDLKKFRRIAAGDRLRGQYQGLSSDPNSLSNLDQDLPNNMIHQVKIKSLPQEWLWCETWCDDKSKSSAKTIDLCNNPLTKEPKLDSAHRIVPEWPSYDQEIKQLQSEFESHGGSKAVSDKTQKEDIEKQLGKTSHKHGEL